MAGTGYNLTLSSDIHVIVLQDGLSHRCPQDSESCVVDAVFAAVDKLKQSVGRIASHNIAIVGLEKWSNATANELCLQVSFAFVCHLVSPLTKPCL